MRKAMNKTLNYFLGKEDVNESNVEDELKQMSSFKRKFADKIADRLDRLGVFDKFNYSHVMSVLLNVVHSIRDGSEIETSDVSTYADTVRDRLEFGPKRENTNESFEEVGPDKVTFTTDGIRVAIGYVGGSELMINVGTERVFLSREHVEAIKKNVFKCE